MLNDGLDRQNLCSLVRRVMRHYIAAKYTGMPQTFHAAPLGFAYLDDSVFQAFREAGFATFKNLHVRVTLPGWFTKGAPQRPELSDSIKQVLTTLYNVEASYINKLVKLDVIMDELRAPGAAVDPKVLDKLAKDFVSMADNLDEFRENAFFAVFDCLIKEGSGGRAQRNSALLLEITPQGAATVTKYISPGVLRPAEVPVPSEAAAAATA